eukprot:CAMPEP_0173173852 /NCGR_PEP_ID=MMETSP1141-20130122/3047_1 /TAXON_ID=483371 /ORGANISM="non described non described, Strain CCMP2298" /LENGTH=708 /DNA_ID=CAMNT_0014095951 /DNA_START=17 /DNA_END=2143 /DNA_ORIENTATION=+
MATPILNQETERDNRFQPGSTGANVTGGHSPRSGGHSPRSGGNSPRSGVHSPRFRRDKPTGTPPIRRSKFGALGQSASLPNLSKLDTEGDYGDLMIEDDHLFSFETGVIFSRQSEDSREDEDASEVSLQHKKLRTKNPSRVPSTDRPNVPLKRESGTSLLQYPFSVGLEQDPLSMLAQQIDPIDGDLVEFAPLDMLYDESMIDDMAIALSSGSLSSLDAHDGKLNAQQICSKMSVSSKLSSWSHNSNMTQQLDDFCADGLLVQTFSEQSVTEQMIDDGLEKGDSDEWKSMNFDFDIADGDHSLKTDRVKFRRSSGVHLKNGVASETDTVSFADMDTRSQDSILEPRRAQKGPLPLSPLGRVAHQGRGYVEDNQAWNQQPVLYPMPNGIPQFMPSVPPMYDPATGIVYYPHMPPLAPFNMQPPVGHMYGYQKQFTAAPMRYQDPEPTDHHNPSSATGKYFHPIAPPQDAHASPEPDTCPASPKGTKNKRSPVASQPKAASPLSLAAPDATATGPTAQRSSPVALPSPRTPLSVEGVANLKQSKKKENRGSYRCGRCGKPKVNHVCEFVDGVMTDQAIQAQGPPLDPRTMRRREDDRVISVTPHRTSIQDDFLSMRTSEASSRGLIPRPGSRDELSGPHVAFTNPIDRNPSRDLEDANHGDNNSNMPSRNSSVNSTYGNDSSDSDSNQRSEYNTFSSSGVNLGLSSIFRL